MITRICLTCKEEFLDYPSNKRKFCSQDCWISSPKKKKTVKCFYCSQKFVKSHSEIRRSHHDFCSQACFQQYKVGKNHWAYKGGHLSPQGYVVIYIDKQKIFEHRHIMEKNLGRKLKDEEIVHHINGIKKDNRIENLCIMNRSSHTTLHMTLDSWSQNYEHCIKCLSQERRHEAKGLCTRCYETLRRITARNKRE